MMTRESPPCCEGVSTGPVKQVKRQVVSRGTRRTKHPFFSTGAGVARRLVMANQRSAVWTARMRDAKQVFNELRCALGPTGSSHARTPRHPFDAITLINRDPTRLTRAPLPSQQRRHHRRDAAAHGPGARQILRRATPQAPTLRGPHRRPRRPHRGRRSIHH